MDVYNESVYIISLILDTNTDEVEASIDVYIQMSNNWAQVDGYDHLVDDTRIVFDKKSRHECVWLIQTMSNISNCRENFPDLDARQLILGGLHYVMSMTKYQATGIDPDLRPGSSMGLIGIFLASETQCSPLRRLFLHNIADST